MEVRPDPTASLPITTEEQRAALTALEWLERAGAFAHWHPWSEDSGPYRATIKAALRKMMALQGTSDPVLPAHPTPGLLKAMADAFRKSEEDKLEDDMRLVHEAAHAHLSFKPVATKEVEGYRVEYSKQFGDKWFAEIMDVLYCDRPAAEMVANRLRSRGMRCIRVTGPHKQQIPA